MPSAQNLELAQFMAHRASRQLLELSDTHRYAADMNELLIELTGNIGAVADA